MEKKKGYKKEKRKRKEKRKGRRKEEMSDDSLREGKSSLNAVWDR